MKTNLSSITKRVIYILRITLLVIVLCVVLIGTVGFISKWAAQILHPELFLSNYRTVTEDIFSILVVFEVLDLLHTMSPTRLTDILLLVIARKMVLSMPGEHVLLDAIAFSVILMSRLLLARFLQKTD
ncbi:hypothetical protein [Alicyclobacillus mengziensis]|uniref:Uncharacterized protein n=1 Tax=Alicyclobacillus mengziensis TaxID=2931921 RepID=A0A9X7Z6U1_9BACL|nr:hypothetical protein [Alicyclobacillus mengziensis]QSO46578.1 hypothetical protein JZ786_19265 [Alicyclobacillus mengziensis]